LADGRNTAPTIEHAARAPAALLISVPGPGVTSLSLDCSPGCDRLRITIASPPAQRGRLIVAVEYRAQVMTVLEATTHAEYTKTRWKDRY
jgi:hypothetical protein